MALMGCTAKSGLRLLDRADGVIGHFCIGRQKISMEGIIWQFWNDVVNNWSSAGTVYKSEAIAEKKMRELMDESMVNLCR